MRVALKCVVLLLLVTMRASVFGVPASELKESYQPIVDRNPFGLRPPPPPPTNNVAAPVNAKPKTELYLTGITSYGNPRVKKAYLMTKETAGKKESAYYTLTEGVEKDGIKVLSIDDGARKVRVHTDDGEQILSFQTHGVPPPAGSALKPGQPLPPGQAPNGVPLPQPVNGAFPQPGVPTAQPANPFPTPNVTPGVTANGVAPVNTRQIPSRRVRSGTDTSMGVPTVNGGGIPNANFGGQVPQAELDPAEQYLRAHLNKAAAEKESGIAYPPIPVIGQ